MPQSSGPIPSRQSAAFSAPFMSEDKFEDLVFSAGGDIRNIVVSETCETWTDSSGREHREEETHFSYLPGMYDEVPMPGAGELAECGHRIVTGSALVGGHSVCERAECENNAVTALHAENAKFLNRHEVDAEIIDLHSPVSKGGVA